MIDGLQDKKKINFELEEANNTEPKDANMLSERPAVNRNVQGDGCNGYYRTDGTK